nr:phage tail domain-containing protein [Streptomyces sp. SID14515]
MRFPLRLRRDGAQVYASRTYLTNRGNTETWPRFKLIGPLLSPAIENKTTGQRLAFDLRLPAGEVLEVDTRRREVLHNGANVFGSVTPDSEWFSFAPGPNSAELEAKQGYEGMFAEARWRSAWL